MSTELNVAETKRRFSDLLNRVELTGESVVIKRRGRRVARLVPIGDDDRADTTPSRPRRGLLAAVGAWEDYDDIDQFLEEIRFRRDQTTDREVPDLP
jgi:prevent-host-death family protein